MKKKHLDYIVYMDLIYVNPFRLNLDINVFIGHLKYFFLIEIEKLAICTSISLEEKETIQHSVRPCWPRGFHASLAAIGR